MLILYLIGNLYLLATENAGAKYFAQEEVALSLERNNWWDNRNIKIDRNSQIKIINRFEPSNKKLYKDFPKNDSPQLSSLQEASYANALIDSLITYIPYQT